VPLLVSLPFMFYPKVLDGDTQPWVLSAALIALFTFRTEGFVKRRDGIFILLSLLSIVAYAIRSTEGFFLLRNVYTYATFLILWIVCQRAKGEYFPGAVKATVMIWFTVGLYQYVGATLGYQVAISGRYLAGRMGPPSLTAEASYYGSLSMLQLMYILSEKNAKNALFVICAVASVVLSGSMLAMILLIFPLRRLPTRFRIGILLLLPLFVAGDFYLTSSGLTSRLKSVTGEGLGISGLFLDASLNLRVGHMYFTMFQHLIPSLVLAGPVDFMSQYNDFATNSGLFIETGTNYILPAVGEMIYGSGPLAVVLLMLLLKRAQENCGTRGEKVEKIAFIIACMLNPITISNAFLVLYAQSPTARRAGSHARLEKTYAVS